MKIEQLMKSLVISIPFLLSSLIATSQTLFTIDGEDFSVKEFTTMYEKSQVDQDEKYTKESLEEYVNLFVKYKLKLKEAEEQGLNQDPEVLREIANYEDQLIRTEFDRKVMDDLLREAKNRLKEEICMRHILIDIPGRYRGTADTIYSYNQAVKIRKRLLAGEDFEELAKRNSRDMETKFSGGDLGCFTTLQLSNYELENQAYKMRRGQISMPVRSHLGYHIIEVLDRRPSNGIVSATQLFVRSNNSLPKQEQALAKQKIDSAYTQLLQKKDFDQVAQWLKQQSGVETSVDDVPEFMVGTYEKEFENAIFALNNQGDYSRPVKTSLGWHIFRLNSKAPLPAFDDMESNIRDKIMEDERYTRAKMRFGSELKNTYHFEKVDSVIQKFKKEVASGISHEGWLLPSGFDYQLPFFKIEDRVYTARNFVNFVKEQHELEHYRSFQNYYNTFETNHLMDYHKHHLVETDPEMSQLLKEYRDGIILFNVMEDEDWRKLTTEDLSVKNYYQDHISEFTYPDEVLVTTYTTTENKATKKLMDALEDGKGMSAIRKLQRKFDIEQGQKQLKQKDSTINGKDLWQLGTMVKQMNDSGKYEILVSDRIVDGDTIPYDQVKGKVLASYQAEQEQKWVNRMKEKYSVTINQAVVESLIR